MDVVEQLLLTWLLIWTFVTVLYLFTIPLKNTGLIDVFWGVGFLLVIVITMLYADATAAASAAFGLVWICVTIWALRLTVYEMERFRLKKEDYRYKRLRNRFKEEYWWRSYALVFLPRAVLMFIVSLPIIIAPYNEFTSNPHLMLAGIIWLTGFTYQTVADYQLRKFKDQPRNVQKIYRKGLWRYSRHPNFFGEILMWWGIFLAAAGGPYWPLAILSPIVLTLYYVHDGVADLEKRWSRSVQYKRYKSSTNSLIPWPSKITYR